MADHTLHSITPRPCPSFPLGPRALRESPNSSRTTSSTSIPKTSTSYERAIQPPPSSSSLSNVSAEGSSLDALLREEHDFTLSPEGSPKDVPFFSGSRSQTPTRQPKFSAQRGPGQKPTFENATHQDTSANLSQVALTSRPTTPTSFVLSRPSTPVSSPPGKPKPKPSRLNTVDLDVPSSSLPAKAISPGLKHWQQVRSHVLAPSPADEKISQSLGRTGGKKLGIVSKAAGRFGFRNAAEHLMGYDERRLSSFGPKGDGNELSMEEKEEMARERRKFARDVKTCLDACAAEETRRRLMRLGNISGRSMQEPKNSAASVHASQHTSQRFTFDPDFSAFAPLLTELHRHLPAARAKKLWSRTCPHHGAILAELGVAFLPDSASTDGERQQALEVFGAVVKNWASDSAEEELSRWLWLCRALLIDDRQVRNRGLNLLASFLHSDPSLPSGSHRPEGALPFQTLAESLIVLLHALETTQRGPEEHSVRVQVFLTDLMDGEIIHLDEFSLADVLEDPEISGSHGGFEREVFWIRLGRVLSSNPTMAAWLLSPQGDKLQVRLLLVIRS